MAPLHKSHFSKKNISPSCFGFSFRYLAYKSVILCFTQQPAKTKVDTQNATKIGISADHPPGSSWRSPVFYVIRFWLGRGCASFFFPMVVFGGELREIEGNWGGIEGEWGDWGGVRGIEGDWGGLRGIEGDWGELRGIEGEWGGVRGSEGDWGGLEGNWGELRGIEGDWGGLRGIEGDWGELRGIEGIEGNWGGSRTPPACCWRLRNRGLGPFPGLHERDFSDRKSCIQEWGRGWFW